MVAAVWLGLVLAVTDGDTLRVAVDVLPDQVLTTAVRLAGVDAPELHGACAVEVLRARDAQAALAELVGRGTHRVELRGLRRDKYGRWLADVTNDRGENVAAELLRRGMVRVYAGGARGSWCEPTPTPTPTLPQLLGDGLTT